MRPAYTATATRTERFWVVEIHGLPDNFFGMTQGRTWAEAGEMARDAIAMLLEVPEDSFDVTLTPADEATRQALEALEAARLAAEEASAREATALAEAAKTLTSHGFTVRDAGTALGISYQRVAQLAPRRKAA